MCHLHTPALELHHTCPPSGRKTLQFYRINFGIASPYSCVLDGNFIHAAVSQKIDLRARLAKQVWVVYLSLSLARARAHMRTRTPTTLTHTYIRQARG